jgi:hypothetical protein
MCPDYYKPAHAKLHLAYVLKFKQTKARKQWRCLVLMIFCLLLLCLEPTIIDYERHVKMHQTERKYDIFRILLPRQSLRLPYCRSVT